MVTYTYKQTLLPKDKSRLIDAGEGRQHGRRTWRSPCSRAFSASRSAVKAFLEDRQITHQHETGRTATSPMLFIDYQQFQDGSE